MQKEVNFDEQRFGLFCTDSSYYWSYQLGTHRILSAGSGSVDLWKFKLAFQNHLCTGRNMWFVYAFLLRSFVRGVKTIIGCHFFMDVLYSERHWGKGNGWIANGGQYDKRDQWHAFKERFAVV